MFEKAIIHYPANEDALKQFYYEIAVCYRDAILRYIDIMPLNAGQKLTLIKEIINEVEANQINA
jgi:hypothetical protein